MSGNWTCLGTAPELSQHFVDGQSVTLATPVGKLQLMSRFEPRAPGARLTGQGEARRLPDPPDPRLSGEFRRNERTYSPPLAGFLFFRGLFDFGIAHDAPHWFELQPAEVTGMGKRQESIAAALARRRSPVGRRAIVVGHGRGRVAWRAT